MNELGDGSTTLSFGSFLDMMAPKDGTDDREGRGEIDKIFSLFDVEGKGVITVRDITKVDNNVKFYHAFDIHMTMFRLSKRLANCLGLS